MITKKHLQTLNVSGPRYTSYPTAPVWQSDFSPSHYHHALSTLGAEDTAISLYIHIPFCQTMCYYCGCNVVIRKPNKSEVGDDYVEALGKEMALLYQKTNKKLTLKQLHLGGGTPNFLTSQQLTRLFELIQNYYSFDKQAEIAIEIDPRTVQKDQLKTFKQLGFNRISMGVQDFYLKTQEAINRVQPFEMVDTLFKDLRQLSFESINTDLVYGLPHQTLESFETTLDQLIGLSPERIAFYSFAYVPWLKEHQKLIDTKDLPDDNLKIDLYLLAQKRLVDAGYKAIAMDHFAKESDELSKAYDAGTLHRNFMGYTLKSAQDFIGIGVTSIGYCQNMFIQNTKDLKSYYQSLENNILPVERGLVLNQDDLIRQWVITKLMCQFTIIKSDFENLFQIKFDVYFKESSGHIKQCIDQKLIIEDHDSIQATSLGKLFIRNVAMGFDAYLTPKNQNKTFSKTV